jgi:hypothetical protein
MEHVVRARLTAAGRSVDRQSAKSHAGTKETV